MSFCPNCGAELKQGAAICLSCGHFVQKPEQKPVNESTNTTSLLATLSVIFGSLGFFPLIYIGSIAGLVLSIIALNTPNKAFKERALIGLGLSIGSFLLWILVAIF